jgi:hypothetical protein
MFHVTTFPPHETQLVRMTLLAGPILALVGCAAAPAVPVAAAAGAGTGAAAGAAIGSGSGKVASAAVGGVAGAWIGAKIGQRLERDAQSAAMTAEQRAVNENVVVDWANNRESRCSRAAAHVPRLTGPRVPRVYPSGSHRRPLRGGRRRLLPCNDGFWRLQGVAGTG